MMIRDFTSADRHTILDFCYEREKENMFVIGSLGRSEDPFKDTLYCGFYDNGELIGLGTHFFGRFGSLVINSQSPAALAALTDHIVKKKHPVKFVPAFTRYALPMIERLKTHGINPKKIRDETVFLLTANTFHDHARGGAEQGKESDIEDIVKLNRLSDGEDIDAPISEQVRKQIFIDEEFLLRENGVLIARACLHGSSEHYAQVGGVVTHPEYRGKGHAKHVVSAICSHWLGKGKEIILFCANENTAANKVYHALGFQPIDAFTLGIY